MVEKIKSILPLIRTQEGIGLFAMLKMDDQSDGWSLLFSGQSFDDDATRVKVFSKVVDILRDNLQSEELGDIARVGVFAPQNHIVEDVSKYPEGEKLINVKANGNIVYEGYVLLNTLISAVMVAP